MSKTVLTDSLLPRIPLVTEITHNHKPAKAGTSAALTNLCNPVVEKCTNIRVRPNTTAIEFVSIPVAKVKCVWTK